LFQKGESVTLGFVILLGKWGCYNAIRRRPDFHRARQAAQPLGTVIAPAPGRVKGNRTHAFFRQMKWRNNEF
jgi:hypothetical protein